MTVELDTTWTEIVLGIIVVAGGALGGFSSELLKTRKIAGVDEQGVIERRQSLTARFYDAGTWASVLLGVVAAAIAMALLNPIEEIAAVAPADATASATEPTEQYDFWKVLGLVLTAGVSAPAFLAITQERFLALATQDRFAGALTSIEQTVQAQGNAPTADAVNATQAAVSAIVADNLSSPKSG